MLPKISLLEELRKGGYEASLITTFNAYLPFYEEVVLRRLVSNGVRHNVLIMDSQQYAASLRSHPPRLAGRRYTLMPIGVAGAFHPKLIFLVGKNKGLVIIGSHNLTLAGFGFNRELTNVVRIGGADDLAGTAVASEVWTEVEFWLNIVADLVPRHVANMVQRVREFAPWIKAGQIPDADIKVLAGRPGGRPLWEQLTDLTDGHATDVFVSGAFFDQQHKFLNRVKQDMQPDRLIVGVDPSTVQIPIKVKSMSGVTLVRANSLGVEKDQEENSGPYLHAKGILIRQKSGGNIFASGSANPSSPAWLATSTSGNVELMLALRGERASATAESIGFTALAGMTLLDDRDWITIQNNQEVNTETELTGYKSWLAVVENERILVNSMLLESLSSPDFVLLDLEGQEISRSNRLKTEGELGVIEFSSDELVKAFALDCMVAGELKLKLLLHHSQAIEEQSRTGVQRRFKEALLSLETDTPNIGLLIECIDKIIFSDSNAVGAIVQREGQTRDKATTIEGRELTSLAIDVADTKKRKAKHRLSHAGDFAYLLDALIYHLRVQEDKAVEELDRHGRSEEEQVGADDEEDIEIAQHSANEQDELLKLCHSKVRTVINRIVAQMKAYSVGKQSLNNVLVRLLGVLAVLRELRGCDGRVAWVEKGKTTVPKELRFRLLEEVMLYMFEGQPSLLHLESQGKEFEQSDDMARLKGLLLWLAWDCGLTINLQKLFMESPDQLRERLRQNAMVLALAQVINADEVVIDEARQSIGSLTSSEMDWLKEIERVAAQCDSLKSGDSVFEFTDEIEPGDIAVHKSIKNWDLRIVASSDGRSISLIKLSKDKDRITYTSEHLDVKRFSQDSLGGK